MTKKIIITKILALFDKKRRAQVIKNQLKKYGYICEIGDIQTRTINGHAVSEYPLIFIKERRS